MRRTLPLVVIGILILSGLGMAMARLGDRNPEPDTPVEPSPEGSVPIGAPILTDPGITAPEPSPGTPNTLPVKVPPAAPVPTRPTQTVPGNEPVPDVFVPEPKLVTPRPGMENLHKLGWDKAEILGDRKVRIHFVSGVEPCSVLDRVEVAPSGDRLVITLFEGNDPAARNTACIMIAQFKAVDVQLAEPVGGRTIVDGAE